jgi:predicted metalloprotease
MRPYIARWVRRSGIALVLAASTALPSAAQPARFQSLAPAPAPADVTEDDVAASNAKVRMTYDALVSMWAEDFEQLGARFYAPQLVRHRGAIRTSCGVIYPNNAAYCPMRNVIYFDDVFLARQAKAAARQLGTDGDMAAVGIIAHEFGHAVASQLGADSPVPYENEAAADCLAGAFTRRSEQDGFLEPGDLDEAFLGLAAAGDPTPRRTGDPRRDARIVTRAALLGHGTRDQRLANFDAGYRGGAGACLEELR